VLILAMGGELNIAFVLPAIFSDDFYAPSASADAFHIIFPDGAVNAETDITGTAAINFGQALTEKFGQLRQSIAGTCQEIIALVGGLGQSKST